MISFFTILNPFMIEFITMYEPHIDSTEAFLSVDSLDKNTQTDPVTNTSRNNKIEIGYRQSFQIKNSMHLEGFPEDYIHVYRKGLDFSVLNTSYSTFDLTFRRGKHHYVGFSVGGFSLDEEGFFYLQNVGNVTDTIPAYIHRESKTGLHLAVPILLELHSSKMSRMFLEFAIHGFQLSPFIISSNIEESDFQNLSNSETYMIDECADYSFTCSSIESNFFVPLLSLGLGKEFNVKKHNISLYVETSGIPTAFANAGAHLKISRNVNSKDK